jgi:hypothetical protein
MSLIDKAMVKIYVTLVKKGWKSIEEVPTHLQEAVIKKINEG